jgi:hypothetical protein
MSEQEKEQAEVEQAENTEEQPGAEPESGDESTEQQQPAEPPVEPEASGFQKRINKVTAEKYEYRRRAEAAEEALKKHSQAPAHKAKGAPTLADPDIDYDDEKYQAALIDYRVDQRLQAAQEERRQRRQQEQQAKMADDFAKKIESSNVPEDYSDAIDKMAHSVVFDMGVVSAIQQADNGPELAYYLAQNLDIADNISRMSPVSAALELGKISVQLSAGKKTSKSASKAPNPVTPVKPGKPGAKNIYDVNSDVSMSEVMGAED